MQLGHRCPPPFRQIGDSEVLETYPSYFWVIGRFIHPLRVISDETPRDLQMELIAKAKHGIEMFLGQQTLGLLLPRSTDKAQAALTILNGWWEIFAGNALPGSFGDLATLRLTLEGFGISLQDEMDRLATFTVVGKGNLDVHKLVKNASRGYPVAVLELIDEFMKSEIDTAGTCLAFELPTSCGFHLLRAVEIGLKGYLHAKTGSLPAKMNQRNWGEYIRLLEQAHANADLIDVLKVLKTKRNPLMHPQDNLTVMEAVSLLCLCQAGIEALTDNVRKDSLDTKFKESLKLLPTL